MRVHDAVSAPGVAPQRVARSFALRGLGGMTLLALVLLTLRVLTLWALPLTDKTEARYGELARETQATSSWVMPQLEPGRPFWAKPPLSSWAGGLGVRMLGVQPAAVRLPALLAVLASLACIMLATRQLAGARAAMISGVAFATMPITLTMAGGVMTDPYLGLGLAMSFVASMRVLSDDAEAPGWWPWMLWAGVAIGLLAKGPIAAIFALAPWVVGIRSGVVLRLFSRRSLAAAIVILSPVAVWGLAAESESPGFLHYFIVGEHYERFVDPQFEDRYGSPHNKPMGSILLYALIGLAPWSIVAWTVRRKILRRVTSGRARWALVVSVATPLVLFCFSRSLLWTYAYPSSFGLAVLIGAALAPDARPFSRGLMVSMGVAAVGMALALLAVTLRPGLLDRSSWERFYTEGRVMAQTVFLYEDVPYSAQFYAKTRPRRSAPVNDPAWQRLLRRCDGQLLIIREDRLERIPRSVFRKLTRVDSHGRHAVFRPCDRLAPESK